MLIIRRVILIIILSGLAFVFYRIVNPDGADALLAKIRGFSIISKVWAPANPNYNTGSINSLTDSENITSGQIITGSAQSTGVADLDMDDLYDEELDRLNDIIQQNTSTNKIKGDLNYYNFNYKFSLKFPGSRDGYQIEIYTGTTGEYHLIFSFDDKDYFILYVVENNYYKDNKQSKFSHTTYINQDNKYTFVYVQLENQDPKANNIAYIIKTFKLIPQETIKTSNTSNTITPKIIPPAKSNTSSDPNYLRQIFDSFVK